MKQRKQKSYKERTKNTVSHKSMQQFREDLQMTYQGGEEYGAKVNHQRQFLGDVFQNNESRKYL